MPILFGMGRILRGVLIALVWILAVPAGAGDYWRYSDASGNIRFVDNVERVPPALRGSARRISMSGAGAPTLNRSQTGPPPARRSAEIDTLTTTRRGEVTVYTAPWCGWCRKTLAWLDERDVVYTNKDIEARPEYRAELIEKTGRTSIPVVEMSGELIRGFSPGRMNELL